MSYTTALYQTWTLCITFAARHQQKGVTHDSEVQKYSEPNKRAAFDVSLQLFDCNVTRRSYMEVV